MFTRIAGQNEVGLGLFRMRRWAEQVCVKLEGLSGPVLCAAFERSNSRHHTLYASVASCAQVPVSMSSTIALKLIDRRVPRRQRERRGTTPQRTGIGEVAVTFTTPGYLPARASVLMAA